MAEVHWMKIERSQDLATTRYTCVACGRCLEFRPDGMRVIAKGDQHVSHRGGVFGEMDHAIELVQQKTPPQLH